MVSVVIPTHDRPTMLTRAVQSALGQTLREIEVIVVDDASSHSTSTAIERFTDDRLRFERMSENVGQGAARNLGMAVANGEWVAFLDDDDEWLPRHLEGLVRVAQREDPAGVVYRPYLVAVGDRVVRQRIHLAQGNVLGELASGWAPSLTSGLVVKRGVCGPGYDDDLVGIEDFDFWLQLATRTTFAVHPAPLVIVDKTPRPDRTNMGVARRLRAIDRLEDKWMPDLERRRLGVDFAATCNQLRLATRLNAGEADSTRERLSTLRDAAVTGSVASSTRLSGILRLVLGPTPTNLVQRGYFRLAGVSRERVLASGRAQPSLKPRTHRPRNVGPRGSDPTREGGP